MRRSSLLIILSVCAIIALQTKSATQEIADRIVAIVDREIILESELNTQVQMIAMQQRIDQRRIPELKDQILEGMINKRLLLAKAIKDSVVVSESEIERELQNQLRYYEQNFGSLDRVAEIIGTTVPRMRREMRDELRKELLVQRLQSEKVMNIRVSRREVEEFYHKYKDELPPIEERVEVAHLFMIPGDDPHIRGRALEKAEAIRDSILAGADFAELAARHSADAGSADRGGDLGWTRRGLFVREFEEAAFSMNPGDISDIVETQFGLHIIKLDDRRGDAVRPRHILLRIERTDESDKPTTDRLRELRGKALDGTSFAELAKEYSQDTDTAPFGGNLGTVPVENLDSDIRRVVAGLEEGEISEPARIQFGDNYGYSIIKLIRRIPEHNATLEQDWNIIEQYALEYKMQNEFERVIEELRKDIYWEVLL